MNPDRACPPGELEGPKMVGTLRTASPTGQHPLQDSVPYKSAPATCAAGL